ncbi:MAG: ester cyclase [Saprospirales bacterium]|nr:ester cyclase [Saprospirales bacterium]
MRRNGISIGFKAWFSGTNNGSLMGNPATGNKVSLPFVAFFKFDNAGKIVEINTQFDQTAFNNQLAAANPMANKQVAVSTLEALNSRNLDAVTANFAADATFHGWGPQPPGRRISQGHERHAQRIPRFKIHGARRDGRKARK